MPNDFIIKEAEPETMSVDLSRTVARITRQVRKAKRLLEEETAKAESLLAVMETTKKPG